MPSQSEIEAGMEAYMNLPLSAQGRVIVEAALTAAEKVRQDPPGQERFTGRHDQYLDHRARIAYLEKELEARTQPERDQPTQSVYGNGYWPSQPETGQPMYGVCGYEMEDGVCSKHRTKSCADFSTGQPITHPLEPSCAVCGDQSEDCPSCGEPIPDEAVEAVARKLVPRDAKPFCNCSNPLSKAAGGCPTHSPSAYRLPAPGFAAYEPQARELLTAAAPIIRQQALAEGLNEAAVKRIQDETWKAATQIALAEVKARVEALQGPGCVEEYALALEDALTALDGSNDE